jgi:hypothetical protein
MTDQKRCYACQQRHPREHFGRDRSRPDGLSNQCKECKRRYAAAHLERARERQRARMRRLRSTREGLERERERSRERNRRYCERHPERVRESRHKYVSANPERERERAREKERMRSAFKRASVVAVSPSDHLQIAEVYREARIGSAFAVAAGLSPLHVDHVQALAEGGQHVAANLQLLPERLNLRKSTRTHAVMLATDAEYRDWCEGPPTFEV